MELRVIRKLVLVLDDSILGMVVDMRTLKCKKCGTMFKFPERLKKHEEIAHNKKKEKCRACGSEFHSIENLRKHKKNCTEKV